MINFKEPTIEGGIQSKHTTEPEVVGKNEKPADHELDVEALETKAFAKCQKIVDTLRSENLLEKLRNDADGAVKDKRGKIQKGIRDGEIDDLREILDSTEGDWLARPSYYFALVDLFLSNH